MTHREKLLLASQLLWLMFMVIVMLQSHDFSRRLARLEEQVTRFKWQQMDMQYQQEQIQETQEMLRSWIEG